MNIYDIEKEVHLLKEKNDALVSYVQGLTAEKTVRHAFSVDVENAHTSVYMALDIAKRYIKGTATQQALLSAIDIIDSQLNDWKFTGAQLESHLNTQQLIRLEQLNDDFLEQFRVCVAQLRTLAMRHDYSSF
ncbi:hypothetical protein GF342_00500 [Candidatus Woesearchaeota archaeon]|nr:hypothetical protein [Candidatus Woesearchaeota archaeon]